MPPSVVVVGSCNMDLVTRAERLPRRGETIAGSLFGTFLGGKGLNQAVAARRMGASVGMVARIGDDAFGRQVHQALDLEGVDRARVAVDQATGTGTATILVEHTSGDNCIIVVPGANGALSVADVDAAGELLTTARVVLLQLEIPIDVVIRAAELAHAAGATVLLTPAPARPLPERLTALVDVLLPNETELGTLLGDDAASAEGPTAVPGRTDGARRLLASGCGAVVLTLGERGALVVTPGGEQAIRPFRVSAVDTVAAGDAFAGTLAALLAEASTSLPDRPRASTSLPNRPRASTSLSDRPTNTSLPGRPGDRQLIEAAQWAAAAGALAVTRTGALPSLPHRAEVERLIRNDER